jgi:hypothetical protein
MPLLRPAALLLVLAACQQEVDFTPRNPPVVNPDPAPPDHGSWLSMDVAPDGQRLVIAYYDRTMGGLGFAVGASDEGGAITWAHEQVDGYGDPSSGLDSGDRGKYASMRVAPDGTVWIASYDVGARDLRYAHRVGGAKSWTTGIIDAGSGLTNDAGQWASLDLDANGKPVVAYYDNTAKVLKVARLAEAQDESTPEYEWTSVVARTGEAWSGTDAEGLPISRPADVGKFARLHIDGGTEYIAYYDAAQQRLGVLEGTAGSWSNSFATPEGQNMGAWPSITTEGGTLVVAYHDLGNQDLMVAFRAEGGWQTEKVDSGEYVGADTEVFRRAGNLAIVYFDGQNNDMKLATKSGTVWVTETLGAADNAVGFHNEIVRLGDGFWAASYDFTGRVLFTYRITDG